MSLVSMVPGTASVSGNFMEATSRNLDQESLFRAAAREWQFPLGKERRRLGVCKLQ